MFLPSRGDQEKELLSEEKAYNILLGKDWDQEDFPVDLELPYSVYLYGRENKAFPLIKEDESSAQNAKKEEEAGVTEESVTAEASFDSSQEEVAQFGSRYNTDLLGILTKLRAEAKKKSLLQTLESMSYQGECGEYSFLPGQYCLKGQGQFYELQGQERRDLNP